MWYHISNKRIALKLLNHAKKELKTDYVRMQPYEGICSLIDASWDEYCRDRSNARIDIQETIEKYISKKLGLRSYLHGWLQDKGYLNEEQYDRITRFKVNDPWEHNPDTVALLNKLANTRIAWIDNMIQQVKNTGYLK